MIYFSSLTKRLDAMKHPLYSQIINFSGIDEKGMDLDYHNNVYINVDDMDNLKNNVLYITGLPASGKSELAERLSEKYGIPVIGLDEFSENNFDFSNKTVRKYIQDTQSDGFDMRSGNEAENFLIWLRDAKNPSRVMVEGYQIYRMNFKMKGRLYGPLLEKNKMSMIIVNPDLEIVARNRVTRDGVDETFAGQKTREEFEKLKAAFPDYVEESRKY